MINEHYNLLLCKSLAESSALRQAKVWLHMAWLNDDAYNTMERDEAYRKARKLYYDGWYESKDPLTLEEEQQLSILLAELYLKDGRLKEARQYLLRAVNKSGNKVFNRQAQTVCMIYEKLWRMRRIKKLKQMMKILRLKLVKNKCE